MTPVEIDEELRRGEEELIALDKVRTRDFARGYETQTIDHRAFALMNYLSGLRNARQVNEWEQNL